MKYLLDTNICIYFFKGKFDLATKIEKIGIENCAISEITLAELTFGGHLDLEKHLSINFVVIQFLRERNILLFTNQQIHYK